MPTASSQPPPLALVQRQLDRLDAAIVAEAALLEAYLDADGRRHGRHLTLASGGESGHEQATTDAAGGLQT